MRRRLRLAAGCLGAVNYCERVAAASGGLEKTRDFFRHAANFTCVDPTR